MKDLFKGIPNPLELHCGSMEFIKSRRGHEPLALALTQRSFLCTRFSKSSVLGSWYATCLVDTANVDMVFSNLVSSCAMQPSASLIHFSLDSAVSLTVVKLFEGFDGVRHVTDVFL